MVRGKGLSKGYVENKVNDNKNFLVEINEQTYYRTGDIVALMASDSIILIEKIAK